MRTNKRKAQSKALSNHTHVPVESLAVPMPSFHTSAIQTRQPLPGPQPYFLGTQPELVPPPLPDGIQSLVSPSPSFEVDPTSQADTKPAPSPIPIAHALATGCYLLRYTPTPTGIIAGFTHYDGTLRVEKQGSNTIASGDLYLHRWFPLPFPSPPPVEPNPANGIPIFPRNKYRYYLRVTQILESFTFGNSFIMGFERFLFNAATNTWTNEGNYTAKMSWTTAPASYPNPSQYLTGEVKNTLGVVIGTLSLGWVSKYLRRCLVEIDRVKDSEAPLDNGAGTTWKSVFDALGWDVQVLTSNNDVAEPSGEGWSDAEMHAGMLARRDSTDLDSQWRYHILCVRRIDSTPRGIMYDNGATDSNHVPREGIGISSHWVIPNSPEWGVTQGKRFGTASAPFFRTALHEIGHAMGLYHNTVDNGIMNTTDVIAASGTPANPFPNNIKWSHASDDQKRLRHFPDIHIRPGGTPFGSSYAVTPLSPDDEAISEPVEATGLALRVIPLLDTVPIGAPVRVDVEMTNTSDVPLPAPASLSLKHDHVHGWVTGPSGTTRSFSPLIMCLDEHSTKMLNPGESIRNSLTLLRGGQGALFPMAGIHQIVVQANWEVQGVMVQVEGAAHIMVTPPLTDSHASAALKILSTPDTLLTLVFGGDHLPEGMAAVQAGLDDATLNPHFAYIEAKRVATRFENRKPNLQEAARLLDSTSILSADEVKKAAELIGVAGKAGDSAAKKTIGKVLRTKANKVGADKATLKLVDAL